MLNKRGFMTRSSEDIHNYAKVIDLLPNITPKTARCFGEQTTEVMRYQMRLNQELRWLICDILIEFSRTRSS